ncbi:sigma-54 dependent transcriptional regulator [Afifella sp. IM 167]|uniref:nitrogen assimilation response regulator NtrX n=1 Tax=Afifella sp. IM 167 TaxID=2033586 RepID=UPI001CCD0122|nr:sigma-54 dependent transcriptional regulator [Afifella sp. IM 167]MBZ8132527.1 sigma-54-dependent Fis family transcriptional regulator [Afifella sp. IM 167]
MSTDILVVDDEADIRELVAGILEDEGHGTRTAANSDQALEVIAERRPGLIFLDIWLQGSRLDGLALLDMIYKDHPDLPIVIISGHGNIETAVSAIKRGAYDYIEKPFKADRLVLVAQRALENSRLKKEVAELKHRSGESIDLVGSSSIMHHLRQTVERVSPTNSRVMIFGASGAGKERVARAIHAGSRRANAPFVVLSSASIMPETMEIALFGTEAVNGQGRRVGALEEAHGGTLYLDEIADMPRETQSKILRVLVDQTFERVGGGKKVKVDVRILSSTSRDLESEIKEGRFREDLFHRLAVVPIRVPSLAERREDVPELVDYFMAQLGQTSGLPVRMIADDAMAVLQAHDWPGNLRQLRNNVERLMILTQGDQEATVTAAMLPPEIGEILPATPSDGSAHIMSLPLREAREVFEREYLSAQINRFGGNISRTAEFVGMERSALHRKLKSLGV